MNELNWIDTMPPHAPRCPPCDGRCLSGGGCEAGALSKTPRRELILMGFLLVAVLGTVALLVGWPQ